MTAACGTLSRGSAAPSETAPLPLGAPPPPSAGATDPSGSSPSSGAPTGAGTPRPSSTATSSPAALRLKPSAPGTWHVALSDDFSGSALNSNAWVTCYDWNDAGCTNSGNHEVEWYRPGQVTETDGALLLSAKRRETEGSNGKTYPWTSGMVSTGRESWGGSPRSSFTYGYFAAAIQIPPQTGMFPGFWLMPAGSRTTPPEIDIMEGFSSVVNLQMTLHWAGPGGKDVHSYQRYGPVPYTSGYHVFAVDWEPNSITWYIDGVARYRVTDKAHIPDVAMEVLLNLGVGYPHPPPTTVNSAQMKVDWVRVWQH